MSLHAQPPAPGDLIAERYRVRRPLGEGGMGVVLEAENIITGKRVALKLVHPGEAFDAASVQRLIREARIAARARHPNLIDVYDVGEHQGALFLVEELLEGQPLSEALLDGPVPPGALVATLLPVLEGLAAAHRQGVVHRDIKPSNIFLCVDDRGQPLAAKLLDFGISTAQRRPGDMTEPTLTDTGTVLGTPYYMAPEQLDEARSVDARADIYSLGVLLYSALSGELPYRAENFSTLILRIAMGEHVPLGERCPALPKQLVDVVEKAMAHERDARFASVAELSAALRPFAGRHALHAVRDSRDSLPPISMVRTIATPAGALQAGRARGVGLRLAMAGVVLVVIALGAWLLRGPRDGVSTDAAELREEKPVSAQVSPAKPVATPSALEPPAAIPKPTPPPALPTPAAAQTSEVTETPAQAEMPTRQGVRQTRSRRLAAQRAARAATSTDPLELRSDEF